ncbi:MAG: protein-disulfide reductase DsbD family protein [Verrucomicrobia bacterium]|nr:protein-disulfide reductase DsbD family protein [Verrucomicrobiota bacterium]
MRWIGLLLSLCWMVGQGGMRAESATRVELWTDQSTARPGSTVTAAIRLQMAEGWHIYWRNPGDEVGLKTRVEWTLPPGVKAGAIQWPVPDKTTEKEFDTLTYSGTVVLLVPIEIPADQVLGPMTFKAKVRWLECHEECVPGNATVETRVTVGNLSEVSVHLAEIQSARQRVPRKVQDLPISAVWEASEGVVPRKLVISWKPGSGVSGFDVFPFEAVGGVAPVSIKTEYLDPQNGFLRIRKTVPAGDSGWPDRLEGVLVAKGAEPTAEPAAEPVEFSVPIVAALAGLATARPEPVSMAELLIKLLSAFVGGLILNVMPCVLPVLALKVLGFVQQAKEEPRRVRTLGLVYGAGVLASFLVLAGVALAVQAAGGTASWSAPFQNPIFRVLITVLITLVALNLFGVFELTLGGSAMQKASDLSSKEGWSGAFFNGVLAAVLATPCTAPFLASALAFAFLQPPLVILLFFVAIGAGLALPFVALCWEPAWLRFLPRPGVWMVRFKVAMGFPMLATAMWLFWFTAGRLGESGTGVLWFGLFLVVLAMAAWVWGEFVQRSTRGRGWAMVIAALLLLAGYFGFLERQLDWRTPAGRRVKGLEWQKWSAAAVEQARREGHPVMVDFTADSCLNCKWNKATAIEIDATRARIKELGVWVFEGDFTDGDPIIAEELKKHGRRGVPLVLMYSADLAKAPELLPVVLTPGIVAEALQRAAKR